MGVECKRMSARATDQQEEGYMLVACVETELFYQKYIPKVLQDPLKSKKSR